MGITRLGIAGAVFGALAGGAVGGIPGAMTGAQAGALVGVKIGTAQHGLNAVEDLGKRVVKMGERVVEKGLEMADIWEKFLMGGTAISGSCWSGLEMFKALSNRCSHLTWAETAPCAAVSAGSTVLICTGTYFGAILVHTAIRRFFAKTESVIPSNEILDFPKPVELIKEGGKLKLTGWYYNPSDGHYYDRLGGNRYNTLTSKYEMVGKIGDWYGYQWQLADLGKYYGCDPRTDADKRALLITMAYPLFGAPGSCEEYIESLRYDHPYHHLEK